MSLVSEISPALSIGTNNTSASELKKYCNKLTDKLNYNMQEFKNIEHN